MIPFGGPRLCLHPMAMRAVDQAAARAGLPGTALMESAGRSVADAIRARWPAPGRAVVLVGGGNNGGDGLVVARWLAGAGWRVELVWLADPAGLRGDAARQWRLVRPLRLAAVRVSTAAEADVALARAIGATCVVDAILGTGLRGTIRGPLRRAIRALNALSLEGRGLPVVAVDGPSGLDGDTGRARGIAVRATLTVALGFPRPGLFLADGPAHVGRLLVAPLGFPLGSLAAAGNAPLGWSGLPEAEAALPPRAHNLHKGGAGRLLLVAGSARYPGAAALAATAALRSGVGICLVAAPAPVLRQLLRSLPEAIGLPLPVTPSGALAPAAATAIRRAAREANAVALGPGLTTAGGVRRLVLAALAAERPAVIDADALNVLAADPRPVRRAAPTILTPHPGELGRWLDRSAAAVDRDRLAAAPRAAARWGAHVILKGSPTVVAQPDGRAFLNLTGNPGLAVGGMGDILTGLLGSLLAQGVPAPLAARAAPVLHGLAGDWAQADRGGRAVLPTDLYAYLPLAIREIAAGRGVALLERLEHPYGELLAAGGGR
ncbi:MAG: NAD(P)H-hydrate dehydratase [Gemmatimonadota bacterium]